jgi:hypothetical protein
MRFFMNAGRIRVTFCKLFVTCLSPVLIILNPGAGAANPEEQS